MANIICSIRALSTKIVIQQTAALTGTEKGRGNWVGIKLNLQKFRGTAPPSAETPQVAAGEWRVLSLDGCGVGKNRYPLDVDASVPKNCLFFFLFLTKIKTQVRWWIHSAVQSVSAYCRWRSSIGRHFHQPSIVARDQGGSSGKVCWTQGLSCAV